MASNETSFLEMWEGRMGKEWGSRLAFSISPEATASLPGTRTGEGEAQAGFPNKAWQPSSPFRAGP